MWSSYPCRASVDQPGSSVLVSVTLRKNGIDNGGKMNKCLGSCVCD